MCNRFRMTEGQIALAARYGAEAPFPPDHTIPPPELFPDKPAYVVRQEDGARTLDVMRWGFPRKVPGKRIDKMTGKRPLFWFDVPSRPIVSFAGVWRPVEGGAVFAFLTTDSNPLVAPIHPKAMPVLLDEGDEDRWPTCSFVDAIALAKPFPSQLMTAQQDPAIGGQNQRQDSLFG